MSANKKKLTAWVLGAALGFALVGACGAPIMGAQGHRDAAVVAVSDR
jgi:hypothetical protein